MRDTEPSPPDKGKAETGRAAEEAELRARLEALKADLGVMNAEERAEASAIRHSQSSEGALGVGLRAGSELVAGVLVGCGIGYLLDRQFGTMPLFLIIFMMVGMGAGFMNIYRMGARRTQLTPTQDDGKSGIAPDRKG